MTTARFRTSLLIAVVAALVVAAAGCGGSSGSASGCAPISLAFMGPLTGGDGALGRYSRNGAEVAISGYNVKHPNCPVGLLSYDSQGSADLSVNLADQIVADPSVLGVIGPTFSGESAAAMPAFQKGGVPVITGSATNPILSQSGWTVFHRVVGNDATQGPAAAAYLTQQLGAKRVAVIDDTGLYGKTLADLTAKSLQQDGAEVAVRGSVDPNSVDYKNTVATVRDANVDAVYFGGVTSPGGRLLRQLRDAGITVPFVGGDGLYGGDFFDYAGGAATGAIITCPCLNAEQPSTPRQIAFSNAYQQAYGVKASYFATEYYDAASLFLDAIAAGKTSRAEIQKWLTNANVKGVTKDISFDKTGEIKGSPVFVFQISPEGGYNQVAQVVDGKLTAKK